MPFIVETGAGSSLATSLASTADADGFWADRGGSSNWATASAADKQAALVKASDYVRNGRRYAFRGTKASYSQRQPWPRVGAVEKGGQAIPADVVPWQVVEAVSFLAEQALTVDLQATLERGGQVKRQKADVVEQEFFAGASPEDTIRFVDGLLAPLVKNVAVDPMPHLAQAAMPAAFQSSTFGFTGSV